MEPIPQDLEGDRIMPYVESSREEWGDWDWTKEYFNTGYIDYIAVDASLLDNEAMPETECSYSTLTRRIQTWTTWTSNSFGLHRWPRMRNGMHFIRMTK